jgi:hypothetical protein
MEIRIDASACEKGRQPLRFGMEDDPRVTELRRKLTPEQKLRTAGTMYLAAREFKAAALRNIHPDWSEEKIWEEVRRVFASTRT